MPILDDEYGVFYSDYPTCPHCGNNEDVVRNTSDEISVNETGFSTYNWNCRNCLHAF
jgi:predicted nucleic acid-binding Zn ribbon protein